MSVLHSARKISWAAFHVTSKLATCYPLATALRQVGANPRRHNMGNKRNAIDSNKNVGNTNETHSLSISYWATNVPIAEPMWTSSWAKFVPKWVQLRASQGQIGAKLGRNWSQVGPSWQVGALLAEVDPKPMLHLRRIETVHLWPMLGSCGAALKMCNHKLFVGSTATTPSRLSTFSEAGWTCSHFLHDTIQGNMQFSYTHTQSHSYLHILF